MIKRRGMPRVLAVVMLLASVAACRPEAPKAEYVPRTAAERLLHEAAEAFSAGDVAKARLKAEAAVTEDPKYYLAHGFHGIVLGHVGAVDEAAAAMAAALEIEPDYGEGHLLYGVFLERGGDSEAAKVSYARAVEVFDAAAGRGAGDQEQRTYRAVAVYLLAGRVQGISAIDKVRSAYPDYERAAVVRRNMYDEERPFFLQWAASTKAGPDDGHGPEVK